MPKIQVHDSQAPIAGSDFGVMIPFDNPVNRAVEKSGMQIQSAADLLFERAMQMQEQKDRSIAADMDIRFGDEEREFLSQEFQQERDSADGAVVRGTSFYDQKIKDYSRGLTPRQEDFFIASVRRRREAGLDALSRHQAQQFSAAKTDRVEAFSTSKGMEAQLQFSNLNRLSEMIAESNELIDGLFPQRNNSLDKGKATQRIVLSAVQAAFNAQQPEKARKILARFGGSLPADSMAAALTKYKTETTDAKVLASYDALVLQFGGDFGKIEIATRTPGWGQASGLDLSDETRVRSYVATRQAQAAAEQKAAVEGRKNDEYMQLNRLITDKQYFEAARFLEKEATAIQQTDPALWGRMAKDIETGATTTDATTWGRILTDIRQGKVKTVGQAWESGIKFDKLPDAVKEMEDFKKSGRYGQSVFARSVEAYAAKGSDQADKEDRRLRMESVVRSLMKTNNIGDDYDPKIAQLARAYEESIPSQKKWFSADGPDWYQQSLAGEMIDASRYFDRDIPAANSEEIEKLNDLLKTENLPATPTNKERALESVRTGVHISQIAARRLGPTPEIDQAIREASATFGVDPLLVRIMMRTESSYKGRAVSHKGAQGLMQIMPDTWNYMRNLLASQGIAIGQDPFNVQDNIVVGTAYMKMMLTRFGGDVSKALAAYNAGPEAVDRYDGIPPYTETQAYVAINLAAYDKAKAEGIPAPEHSGTPGKTTAPVTTPQETLERNALIEEFGEAKVRIAEEELAAAKKKRSPANIRLYIESADITEADLTDRVTPAKIPDWPELTRKHGSFKVNDARETLKSQGIAEPTPMQVLKYLEEN